MINHSAWQNCANINKLEFRLEIDFHIREYCTDYTPLLQLVSKVTNTVVRRGHLWIYQKEPKKF